MVFCEFFNKIFWDIVGKWLFLYNLYYVYVYILWLKKKLFNDINEKGRKKVFWKLSVFYKNIID